MTRFMSMTQNSQRPSYDICLWDSGIGVKGHLVSEFRVRFVIPGVIRDLSGEALSL